MKIQKFILIDFNILYYIKLFHFLNRYIKKLKYILIDNIFDLLIEYVDYQIIGLENIYMGLKLIIQWDDIIKTQRRCFIFLLFKYYIY